MKTLATALTTALTLTAASAASAGQINRGSNLAFRHAPAQHDAGYALTGERVGTPHMDRYDHRERTPFFRGGRNTTG